MATLNLQVDANTDDAQEIISNGAVTTAGSFIEIGCKDDPVHVGLRWTSVSGLSGATINTAVLTFRAGTADIGGFEGDWYGEDGASPGTFVAEDDNISDRVKTTATCEGDSADFGDWVGGEDYEFTGDGANFIKDILQELADSYDPSAIVLIHSCVSGIGERLARSHDLEPALATKLDIDYTAAAGGVTVTPPTATLTTSTFSPVIKLVVIPAKRTLSLATFTPVLGLSVIPPPLALSLATFIPTVTTTANVTVTPGVRTLSLGLFAPTVTTTANVTVTPGVRTLSLGLFAPTVTTTANVIVIPGVLVLSLTTFAPTVTATGDVVVTPGTVALSLATFAPVLKIAVTPPTLALNLQAFAPTISTPRLMTPPTATLSLAAFAPTVSAPRLVTPGVVNLSISIFAPTVTVTGNVVITPGVLTLSFSLFAPTVFTPRVVTPGLVALSLTTFIPTITVAAAFMAVWTDSGSVALLLVLDGSVSLPQAVNDGTISIKETEDATV